MPSNREVSTNKEKRKNSPSILAKRHPSSQRHLRPENKTPMNANVIQPPLSNPLFEVQYLSDPAPLPLSKCSLSPHLISRYCAPVSFPSTSNGNKSSPAPSKKRSSQISTSPSTSLSSLVSILPINSPDHPAHRQSGLFAKRDLAPGTWIGDYTGYVHTEEDADEESRYDLTIERWWEEQGENEDEDGDEERDKQKGENLTEDGSGSTERTQKVVTVAIDATYAGNETRFINDYRGIPGIQRPNTEFQLREAPLLRSQAPELSRQSFSRGDAKPVAVGVRMGVAVLGGKGRTKGIRKGEEILVSYGKGFWKEKEKESGEDGDLDRGKVV